MNQYVIIAHDGSDSEASERRMSARPLHFAGVRDLKANNQFIVGGAVLDETGKMTGSVMLVQFDDVSALQN